MSQPYSSATDSNSDTTNSNMPNQNPVLNYYREWTNKTPVVTRYSMIIITIIYILSWFLPLDVYQLGNISYFTVLTFEIYRIITSPLVGNSFFSTIMIFFFFPQMGASFEYSIGSTSFLSLMFTITVLTNLIFTSICFLMYAFGVAEALFWSSSGFWTIIFALITIDCLRIPDAPRQIMFVPINIPSKYFPLLLYAFFSLLSGFDLGFAIAICLGHASVKGYLDRLRPSSYFFEQLESPSGMLYTVSRASGWVLAGTTGHDAWIPVNTVDRDGEDDSSAHASSGPPPTAAGASSGFPNIGGFGNWNKTSETESQEQNTFPGSGRTLSNQGGGGGSRPSVPIQGSVLSRQEKEAIAARRLAALENQQKQSSSPNY